MHKKIFSILIYLFAIIGFLLTGGYFAVRFGFTNTNGIIDTQRESFLANSISTHKTNNTTPIWAETEEWLVFKEAVRKDKDVIIKAANKADIDPRIIVANLAVEQLRLFFSTREIYKTVFAPLKILGTQSQFSWGVMGIKPETAEKIEYHLITNTSPFYPGPNYEHLLDFKTKEHGAERFARLTDQRDRYYSYLYASLYIKEILTQWSKAGFDISHKPEIIATLYNIGFERSLPKNNPLVGGAQIDIGTETYSFGSLAADFYNSDELTDIFPKK